MEISTKKISLRINKKLIYRFHLAIPHLCAAHDQDMPDTMEFFYYHMCVFASQIQLVKLKHQNVSVFLLENG